MFNLRGHNQEEVSENYQNIVRENIHGKLHGKPGKIREKILDEFVGILKRFIKTG